MKRILLSLLVIIGITSGVIAGARAYFSDTETSPDNTLVAGTIDISVDGENPWETTYLTSELDDIKPGMSKEITFSVKNEGANALVLWKRINITSRDNGSNPEPEQEADPSGLVNNIDSQIHYDMTVGAVNTIPLAWNVMMSDVDQLWIPLGKVEAGATLPVTQVYKLDELTGNEYQGDIITFNIDLYAEQLNAPGPSHTTNGVVLENKDTTDWAPIMDGTWGILTWDAGGNYRLRAWGLPGTQYQLQAWDYATDSNITYFGPVNGGGNLNYTGTYAGLTTNVATKYWLRETASWLNAQTLWESNLVN